MMRKTIIATAMAALLAIGLTARAQSSNFLSSVESYATSFNTNYTWTNVSYEISTGYKQVTGQGAVNVLDAQWDCWKGLNVGAEGQFSGVGSAVNGAEAQIGYAIVQHYDTKVDIDLRMGMAENMQENKTGVFEPAVFLEKKQTLNTATKVGLSMPFYFRGKFNNTPTVYVEEVVTF
jgi:hypothetical protein